MLPFSYNFYLLKCVVLLEVGKGLGVLCYKFSGWFGLIETVWFLALRKGIHWISLGTSLESSLWLGHWCFLNWETAVSWLGSCYLLGSYVLVGCFLDLLVAWFHVALAVLVWVYLLKVYCWFRPKARFLFLGEEKKYYFLTLYSFSSRSCGCSANLLKMLVS